MKRQKGQAFILVLVFLAVGALLIVPALRFTFTSLRSQSILEDTLAKQYVADGAVEDALWRMLNGVLDILNSENTSYTYDFELDSARFPVLIQIAKVPQSDWVKYEQIQVKVEVVPKWLEANADNTTFTYIIRIDSPQWDLGDFGFALPLGLTYTDNSTLYVGPEKPTVLDPDAPVDYPMVWMNEQWVEMNDGEDPLITDEPDGRQRLTWNLYDYLSGFEGRRAFIQAFQASGIPVWGVHYVESSFAFESLTVETGKTATLGVAMYNILIDYGGLTYQVVVGYDSTTGEMKMVSYQIAK
jgi:hypothetical protein